MKEVDYQNERVDSINETTAMAHETTLLIHVFIQPILKKWMNLM